METTDAKNKNDSTKIADTSNKMNYLETAKARNNSDCFW